ncbi:MAG TPA: hypothetical protein H9846_06915 [Candidatus Gemmiger excrementipullorum]|uniref:Uncharacterized protein n=1 Tax=Candidatus Gemmiger excrementipullorum TaxID=2838610 RepID=A0A9D1Y1B5_9FIRM|nr:hypothetical protein [Candidatus Gemmiger excrementipullorum]
MKNEKIKMKNAGAARSAAGFKICMAFFSVRRGRMHAARERLPYVTVFAL